MNNLAQHGIIRMADDINYLFQGQNNGPNHDKETPKLQLPQVVVVGTQSSGKSTVINRLMSMNLLPTGTSMVTRTPLVLQLRKIEDNSPVALFKTMSGTGWVVTRKIQLTHPIPTESEVEQIRDQIRLETNQLAGEGMNISADPIMMELRSPNVPNLSLVDLPGLIMIPNTEQGQPSDIKQQIEKLANSFICREKVIVLVIIQARTDLETDQGLAFIKQHKETDDRRFIGVLTKPDLMNQGTSIKQYLTNEISTDLQINEGYFMMKNGGENENKDQNYDQLEKQYISSHPIYSQSTVADRVGIQPFRQRLTQLLLKSISKSLPEVMDRIQQLDHQLSDRLKQLGDPIPDNDETRLGMMNGLIRRLSDRTVSLLEDRGLDLSFGSQIKSLFCDYRNSLNKHRLFTGSDLYPTSYFRDLIHNFEGNHMSFSVPYVEVLECCIRDQRKNPFQYLITFSEQCLDSVYGLLCGCLQRAADEIIPFSQLRRVLIDQIAYQLLTVYREQVAIKIRDFIRYETSYIWSDDSRFREMLRETIKKPLTTTTNDEYEDLREFLEEYYRTVKFTFANCVPKIIMERMVCQLEENLYHEAYQFLVVKRRVELLQENEDAATERIRVKQLKHKIQLIKASQSQ